MKKNLFVRNSMKKPPPRLESVTTHFLRKLSHPPPNIKQSISNSLTSKTNFAHYDYKPSNSKKNFFQKCPTFPTSPESPLSIRNPSRAASGALPPRAARPSRVAPLVPGAGHSPRAYIYIYVRALPLPPGAPLPSAALVPLFPPVFLPFRPVFR